MKKLAIITGGSAGLGAALARLLLDKKYHVKELSRSGEGKSPAHVTIDFRDELESIRVLNTLFSELSLLRWDRIYLVNNVGVLDPIGPLGKGDEKGWIDNIRVNLMSDLVTSGLFLKYFTDHEAKCHIAHISSGAARHPYSGWALYCASKAAMEMFSQCVALDLFECHLDQRMTSFVINPGKMNTDMQTHIRRQSKRIFPAVKRFVEYKQAGELADPIRVAAAIYRIMNLPPVNGQYYMARDFF